MKYLAEAILLSVIVLCMTTCSVLYIGDPDIHDAIRKRIETGAPNAP